MSLTDARKMWKLAACPEGVHSHDCRRLGVSGNPSQRSKDIADHVPFWTKRESRNKRPGARWWADGFQPPDALPVRPNNGSEGGDASETGTASLSVSPQPASVAPLSTAPTCPRCEGAGQLWSGVECPACFGEGVISPRRVNSLPRAA